MGCLWMVIEKSNIVFWMTNTTQRVQKTVILYFSAAFLQLPSVSGEESIPEAGSFFPFNMIKVQMINFFGAKKVWIESR